MTFANIAGIIAGAIFGMFIGMWWGWGARTLNITKAGYTILTLGDKLYVVKTPNLVRDLGVDESETEDQ